MPLTDFDVVSYDPLLKRFVVNFGDFDSVTHLAYLPILPGRFVENVRVRVATAFNASTTLLAGDTASASAFIAATMLNPTTLGAVKNSSHNGVEDQTSGVTVFVANAEGKNYPTGDQLKLTVNQAVTVGQLIVEIIYDGYKAPERGMVDHINPTYGKPDFSTVVWADPHDYTKPPSIP